MYGRDYRVGYRINVLEQGSLNLKIGVDAERRESPMFQLQERSGGNGPARPRARSLRRKNGADS